MKSTDVLSNSSNFLKMNLSELNLSRKNSTELNSTELDLSRMNTTRLNSSEIEFCTDFRSKLFEKKIISVTSQKIIITLKTSNSVKSINSNIEMLNTFISLKRKSSQSSLVSLHFKSTFEQASKHQSNETTKNSIKKSRFDINLKSSIVRLIERNQLLTQLKLTKTALLKTTEISNDVCILNVIDQVRELIASNYACIKNFFIKTLHQKVNKMMKKIDNTDVNKSLKHSMIKTCNLNSNSAHIVKSNSNSETAKLT